MPLASTTNTQAKIVDSLKMIEDSTGDRELRAIAGSNSSSTMESILLGVPLAEYLPIGGKTNEGGNRSTENLESRPVFGRRASIRLELVPQDPVIGTAVEDRLTKDVQPRRVLRRNSSSTSDSRPCHPLVGTVNDQTRRAQWRPQSERL
jgi:hypothetical protein